MTDRAEVVVFWVFAIPLIMSALGVIIARNPVHAAMSLVAAFFCMAGVYVLLTAHLIAFLQILVYAGAIMVLFLFVIMLLSLSDEDLGVPRLRAMQVMGALGAVGVVALVVRAVAQAGVQPMRMVNPETFGTVKEVGRILFRDYLLPFEATSVLLLVAIVGAVIVAKQKV
jgi:NADH-quinone oxidoreductase subunit J